MNNVIKCMVMCICLATLIGCTHSHKHLLRPSYLASKPSLLDSMPRANAIQVITTRSPLFYSHAAVRMIYKNQVLFWDPSGAYGVEDEHSAYYIEHPMPKEFRRSEDLITQGVPDLARYWQYSIFTGDDAMEIFEWTLNDKQAKFYYELLLKGADQRAHKINFFTHDSATICSAAVSSFLIRFGNDIIPLQERYFLPHGLAHDLHTLNPERIYYFELRRPARIFIRTPSEK